MAALSGGFLLKVKFTFCPVVKRLKLLRPHNQGMQDAKAAKPSKNCVRTEEVEDEDWKRLGHLPSEQKVAIMMDMTNGCVRVCVDGIRAQNPQISNEELLAKLRERLEFSKRDRLHEG